MVYVPSSAEGNNGLLTSGRLLAQPPELVQHPPSPSSASKKKKKKKKKKSVESNVEELQPWATRNNTRNGAGSTLGNRL